MDRIRLANLVRSLGMKKVFKFNTNNIGVKTFNADKIR